MREFVFKPGDFFKVYDNDSNQTTLVRVKTIYKGFVTLEFDNGFDQEVWINDEQEDVQRA